MNQLPVPISDERPWVVFAACRDAEAGLFFSEAPDAVAAAVKLCAACPVRTDCLEYALATRERFGIWGGTTPQQRRRLLRRSVA